MRNLDILEYNHIVGGATKGEIIGNAALYSATIGLVGGTVAGGIASHACGFGSLGTLVLACAGGFTGFSLGLLASPLVSFPVAIVAGE